MNITPRNTPSDPWKTSSILFFGIATATCLYVGNCYNNYHFLLGLCFFGLFCSIVYQFIPSDDGDRCAGRGTSIKDGHGIVEDDKTTCLQRIVGISTMVVILLIALYILKDIIEAISPNLENPEHPLTVIRSFILSLLP